MLRRLKPNEETAASPSRLAVGSIGIDVDTHRAWVEEEEVRLTRLSSVASDARDASRACSNRDRLLEDVWDYNTDVLSTRTVDSTSRDCERSGTAGPLIQTVGYRCSGEGNGPGDDEQTASVLVVADHRGLWCHDWMACRSSGSYWKIASKMR